MIAVRPNDPPTESASEDRVRVLDGYTTAWEVGTGLRVSLPPGRYAVTRSESRSSERFLLLDGTYWLRQLD